MNNPTLARDLGQAAGVRAVGTTDEVTECELCGKSGLSHTVIVEFLDENGDSDGEAFLGSDCAARKVAGRADRKLAVKILREAQAADLKRAGAVENSRQFLAYYAGFIAVREDGTERLGGYVREYTRINPLSDREMELEKAEPGYFSVRARQALGRHREVIATGGRSAL